MEQRAGPRASADRAVGVALLERAQARHVALAGILALSAVLNTHRLAQNAYANTFYSAGVKSMLSSWHNFLFVSFDPGGLVTIDKPPLGIWVQAATAKLFGFSPLSLLLPEAIISTIAVAVLYRVISPRLGPIAALVGALTLAVFPSFVAVSRDNGVDPLLILLMILACGAALKAIDTGGWRPLLWCAVLVGLAFNVKTLAAYLILPGIACAYVLCAPGSWVRRLEKLLVAGAVMGVVSFSWIALVELVPPSQRPFVGSSTDNTEIGLTFAYNGFGRVKGEIGGPGQIPTAEGAVVKARPSHARVRRRPSPAPPRLSPVLPNGRDRSAVAFAGPTGPLRLFDHALADQGAWLLPFSLIGLLALLLAIYGLRRGRRDPRLATAIVLGGWLLVETVLLSWSKGIVHPYYMSALAPGVAAMTGAGVVAFAGFARDRDWRAALIPIALATTVAAQLSILHQQRYLHWFVPILIAGTAIGLCAIAIRRLTVPAMAFLLGLVLVAPTAYATTTWLAPVDGTFAAAGPHQAVGEGPYGIDPELTLIDRNLLGYVESHHPSARFSVLVDASTTAAPLILFGSKAAALGGYSGSDPVLDGPGLGQLVARGQARYVVLGGPYASRGGNLATKAVLRACRQVPSDAWHGPPPSIHALVLFDCAGDAHALTVANYSGRAGVG